ncbi:3-isopropylmalate dehydratase small subunit [Pseudoclavibacter alba]|uniref:3-isopropylmalate dehydratase small subunit n=1 Tax=Pseudoclavibacter albus TaxID=272241 RepID=A0ABT2HU95_9MICO|nr:3-isopropylmalate dehydratase small subunit [Pseudoclavibacter alba]MBN6778190.1 3-isopropylmalate dehydratase small subunit [Pseudoclavibacter alba]MCT2041872.1 3-isopropylmalate dehydratase small subunit [Pseudoclavibacter alba]
MEPLTKIEGVAVPLNRSNIDTDQIIPAVYLKRVVKTGYEDALFAGWRGDEDFILNRPEYANPKVLVAGPDFGTGSSREHAVWALRDFGFRVILSARFGEIFRGNAGKQGLLAAQFAETDAERLMDTLLANPGMSVSVDLERREVTAGALVLPFDVDDYTRWRLMEGLDDIALTLRNESNILEFESRRPGWMPRTLPLQR